MSNPGVLCPRCSKPLPVNSPICSDCDQTSSDTGAGADADEEYNRSVSWWMRAAALLAALIVVIAVRLVGRRPELADYVLMLVVEVVLAVTIWGILKWMYPRSRRFLWRTALIPSFLIVALVFAARAAGTRAGPGLVAAAPLPAAPAAPAVALAPVVTIVQTEPLIPRLRMVNECFTSFEAQAKAAANETFKADISALFTLKPASPATILEGRAKLKTLDARLLEFDAAVRKSASELTTKVEGSDASAQVKATVMSAVRQSGTDLVRRCRESIAHQRRLVRQADAILEFMQPRFKRLSAKSAQSAFANPADQEAFQKLVKQFDAFEEESTLVLRRIHQRTDQSKQQLLVALTQPREQPQASAAPR